jgi:hypothetical protein
MEFEWVAVNKIRSKFENLRFAEWTLLRFSYRFCVDIIAFYLPHVYKKPQQFSLRYKMANFNRSFGVLGTKTSASHEIDWRSKMRPASANAFRSQVHAIQTWFTEWNECERTIALYSLLRQMTPIHARFLSVVMEHTFRDQAYRTQMYEDQANDKGTIIYIVYVSCALAGQFVIFRRTDISALSGSHFRCS